MASVRFSKKQIPALLVGFLLGACWAYYGTVDPNREFDPEPSNSRFCWLDVVARQPMPQNPTWEAVAYRNDCDFFGSTSIRYVYLLRQGQTVARSTLVFSYEGADPAVEWKNDDTLVIRTRVHDIFRQVIGLIGVKVEYKITVVPWHENVD